jgi:hypothetical protein
VSGEPSSSRAVRAGDWHDGRPDLAFSAPYYYDNLTNEQKQTIAKLSDDVCVINGEDFFIRGVVMMPIVGQEGLFGLGAWVSLSKINFQRYLELFNEPDPTSEAPYFGWFSNRVPGYPETLSLKTEVHLQLYPERPHIVLEPTDHPLSVHQHAGITTDAIQKMIEANLHPHGSAG